MEHTRIYEAWHSYCIHESAPTSLSMHKTKPGALKAINKHRKQMKKDGEFTEFMAWGITEWPLNN